MTSQQEHLQKVILKKTMIYTKAFDRSPDCIVLSKEDYETLKDSHILDNLEVTINHVHLPILYKK